MIKASAISEEVAKARGYRSVTSKAELKGLGFSDYQCRIPALLNPVWSVHGEIATYQSRPDEPRISKDGKVIKYETPGGSRMVLDVPRAARPQLRDPKIPLWVTEGTRKADSAVSKGVCCVALLGVWNWRGSNEQGGKTALPDWELIALNGRLVYLCFDSDVMTKLGVYQALVRLKAFLESRGAVVKIVYLPDGESGSKVGLDDYLAAGHSVEELTVLASDELRAPPSSTEGGVETAGPYRATPNGLIRLKDAEGIEAAPLTNFTAKIVGDIAEDDGAEVCRRFELEATLRGRTTRFSVSASQFPMMNWTTEYLGAEAIVYPGLTNKDHARCAIQMLSREIPRRSVFTHTGWRQVGSAWLYLHANGAIGQDGQVPGVEVRLPQALARYALPPPPNGVALIRAIRASLSLLDLASDRLMVPGLGAVYRAPLGTSDFFIHYAGPTGVFKSEMAALLQQHHGAGMDSRHIPGSWLSTPNFLEGLAFTAKDALLVVDDFAPRGSQTEVNQYHQKADRLLRAQGNSAGRGRLRADATPRPPRPPRGLIISTGEDIPRGQSILARGLILEAGRE